MTTYISAKAPVNITLGLNVVFHPDIWVGNIGKGMDCLLGMDFMMSAGVPLCTAIRAVHLPDEEAIPLAGESGRPPFRIDVPVLAPNFRIIRSGDSITVPIRPGRHDLAALELWVNRERNWLTFALLDGSGVSSAVRVSNATFQSIYLRDGQCVAQLVERRYPPGEAGLV